MVNNLMDIAWGPFLSFLIVVSITPGPNNLTAATLGMKGGMKTAAPFVFGVYLGVAVLLTLVGFLKIALSGFFQQYLLVFKIVGSAYLLWLAWGMIRKTDGPGDGKGNVSFLKGVALQLVNPKGLVFAFAMYALFFDMPMTPLQTIGTSFLTPLVSIVCVGVWAGAGTVLSRFLNDPLHRRIFYFASAGLLVYTVVTIFFHEYAAA